MLQVLSKVYHRNWTNESSSFGDEIRYRERNTKYTEKKLIGGNDLAEDPWASASGSRANYLDKYCEWETKEHFLFRYLLFHHLHKQGQSPLTTGLYHHNDMMGRAAKTGGECWIPFMMILL